MATPVYFDPATWNSSTVAPFTLGGVYSWEGKLYRYVRAAGTAVADGDVVGWNDATTYTVIGANRTTALVGTPACLSAAGVGVGTITANYYGFVLVVGLHTNVKGVATVTLQRAQKASGTNDSGTDVTNAYDPAFGTAVTTITAGRYSVQVSCLGA
jgi:hypothetical protein